MCDQCEPLRELLAAQTEDSFDRIAKRMAEARETDPEGAANAAAEAIIAFAAVTGAFEVVVLAGKNGRMWSSGKSPQDVYRVVEELAADMKRRRISEQN